MSMHSAAGSKLQKADSISCSSNYNMAGRPLVLFMNASPTKYRDQASAWTA